MATGPRGFSVLCAGVLLGMAALTRSIGLVAPLALILVWGAQRISWRRWITRTVLILLPMVFLMGAWMIRNASELGQTILFTSNGINLYIGNNVTSGISYQEPDRSILPLDDPHRELYCDSVAKALALSHITENPVTFFIHGFGKVSYALLFDLDPLLYHLREPGNRGQAGWSVLAVITQSCWYILIVLAGVGAWKIHSHRKILRSPHVLLTAVVVGIMVTIFVTYGSGRYRHAAVPILAVWASASVGYRVNRDQEIKPFSSETVKLSLDR